MVDSLQVPLITDIQLTSSKGLNKLRLFLLYYYPVDFFILVIDGLKGHWEAEHDKEPA